MFRTTILLLGTPRIEHDGVPVEVDTRKAIALAAYLAVTEQRYSRDALAGVSYPLHFEHLAVRNMPGSGKPEELMDAAGISSNHIADAARKLLNA